MGTFESPQCEDDRHDFCNGELDPDQNNDQSQGCECDCHRLAEPVHIEGNPRCHVCGAIFTKTAPGYTCRNCGETSGVSPVVESQPLTREQFEKVEAESQQLQHKIYCTECGVEVPGHEQWCKLSQAVGRVAEPTLPSQTGLATQWYFANVSNYNTVPEMLTAFAAAQVAQLQQQLEHELKHCQDAHAINSDSCERETPKDVWTESAGNPHVAIRLLVEQVAELQQERDKLQLELVKVTKERDGWLHEHNMYRSAWLREIGGQIKAKHWEIDGFVLMTREIKQKADSYSKLAKAARDYMISTGIHDKEDSCQSCLQARATLSKELDKEKS